VEGALSGDPPVSAAELEQLMRDLTPIGLDSDGATTRLAWTDEDRSARRWFASRSDALGRELLRDPAGNLWSVPSQPPPWWGVGSHLDTVREGGRYDGALGVAAAFAVAAREPVAVIAFADEEGARFNTPTFGSKALAGTLDARDALARTDAAGVTLADALRDDGLDPESLAGAAEWIARLGGFLELHIDQSREVQRSGTPVAVVSGLAARLRMQASVVGRADHAGTTLREDRHDALAAAARLIVSAEDCSAGAGAQEMVFTATRIEVEPNAASTVPHRVRLWLDARAPSPERLTRWRERLRDAAREIARERAVEVDLRVAAWSQGTEFSRPVREALAVGAAAAGAAGSDAVLETLCWAGHDAGMLAERIPSGMLLVRNPTGISHAPAEQVALEDAAVGANALIGAVRALG
jgi:N-carbamoyl-L-amino-acid hydrolase